LENDFVYWSKNTNFMVSSFRLKSWLSRTVFLGFRKRKKLRIERSVILNKKFLYIQYCITKLVACPYIWGNRFCPSSLQPTTPKFSNRLGKVTILFLFTCKSLKQRTVFEHSYRHGISEQTAVLFQLQCCNVICNVLVKLCDISCCLFRCKDRYYI